MALTLRRGNYLHMRRLAERSSHVCSFRFKELISNLRKMKTYVINILSAAIMFATADFCNLSQAAQTKDKPTSIQASENDIKAVFLYNFIKFTDWPKDKTAEPNTITIGLLGDHPFTDAFDPVKDKTVRNNRLIIKNFGMFRQSFPQDDAGKLQFANYIEQLRKCHVLFICDSERENFKAIIDAIKGYGVLTVGETEDFLDVGGIIAFIPGTEKPVFEVNLVTCEREGLKISSQVLRLARRVISEGSAEMLNYRPVARKTETTEENLAGILCCDDSPL